MGLKLERLSVVMLIAVVLGFSEVSLMHHHPFRIVSNVPAAFGPEDAKVPATGRPANVGHVCAFCVVGLQGSEPPSPTRWNPYSSTSSPLADPPAVLVLATITDSISKRGPPAA